eukprot:1008414-Rhodomonas_salina.1
MWDKTWQGAFDKAEMVDTIATMLLNGHSTVQILQIQHRLKRGLELLILAMGKELLTSFQTKSQEGFCNGKSKEIQSFFGKLLPPVLLRRLLPNNIAKQYPSMITMNWAGTAAIAEWIQCSQAMEANKHRFEISSKWWTMQKGKTILLVREQEATWQVVLAPVTMMTGFLEQTSSMDRFPIWVSGPLNQTPYVTATDKLAQILHYLALECTTQQRICGTCSSKSLTLLAQE